MRRPKAKLDQHAFRVGEVTDELAYRHRKAADERRDGEYVVGPSGRRVLSQVDDFYLIASVHMLFAQPGQIGVRIQGLRRSTGDVEA
jgi:hypothetical protein